MLLQTVSGHHDAVLYIILAAVREPVKFDFKTVPGGQDLQHPDALGANFPADAVSRNQGNMKDSI